MMIFLFVQWSEAVKNIDWSTNWAAEALLLSQDKI